MHNVTLKSKITLQTLTHVCSMSLIIHHHNIHLIPCKQAGILPISNRHILLHSDVSHELITTLPTISIKHITTNSVESRNILINVNFLTEISNSDFYFHITHNSIYKSFSTHFKIFHRLIQKIFVFIILCAFTCHYKWLPHNLDMSLFLLTKFFCSQCRSLHGINK